MYIKKPKLQIWSLTASTSKYNELQHYIRLQDYRLIQANTGIQDLQDLHEYKKYKINTFLQAILKINSKLLLVE